MSEIINPYSFVNLPPSRNDAKQEQGSLTGKIECFLYPRTHMFIPNTTNDNIFPGEEREHKSYDFYSYEDLSQKINPSCTQPIIPATEPIIPGSSIRGEVRSLYEALSNSCLSAVDNDLILNKRLPNPGDIGILSVKNDTKTLYKAEKYMACYKFCNDDRGVKKFNGRECVDYFDERQLCEGQKVYFKPSGQKYKKLEYMPITVDEICTNTEKPNGFFEGYVLMGEPFENIKHRKHHFTIAKKKCDPSKIISEIELEILERILKLYGDSTAKNHRGYHKYRQYYERIKKNGGEIPVYYKPVGNNLYLSPACISKEVYKKQLKDLLEKGNYNPCHTQKSICPACRLFGFIGKDEKENITALSGRLRFSDARIEYKGDLGQLYEKPKPLKILASPKISSTEFYLQPPNFDYAHFNETECSKTQKDEVQSAIYVSSKGVLTGKSLSALSTMISFQGEENESAPDIFPSFDEKNEPNGAQMWTYDNAFNWSNSVPPKPETISLYEPRIKGRKFYWQHNQKCNFKDFIYAGKPGKMNTTVRLLKPCSQEAKDENPDYRFSFTVYFDRLTQDELDKLIATLRLGAKGYHSIGHGKPLGMGSARIIVNKVKLRELSIVAGKIIRKDNKAYEDKKQSLIDAFPESKSCARQVEIITQLHEFKSEIAYPTPDDGSHIYKWFSKNRGNMNKPSIVQILPNIPTASLTEDKLERAISVRGN